MSHKSPLELQKKKPEFGNQQNRGADILKVARIKIVQKGTYLKTTITLMLGTSCTPGFTAEKIPKSKAT